MRHYGIGPVTATGIVAELGDVSRLSASRKAVRCAGLDVGVHRPGRHSRLGKLTRQGSPQPRWALYEAAQSACKPRSPDHGDYLELKARGLSHTRATITIARKLARRRFHSLRRLGPAALEPVTRVDPAACQSRPPSPPVPDDTQASGQLPQVLRHPPTSGGPKKTERPESIPADRPINHHVAGHQAVDPDKPGRPRNERTHRNRKPPQPLTTEPDNGPGSDKQHYPPALLAVLRSGSGSRQARPP
jgi:hypothetical protein